MALTTLARVKALHGSITGTSVDAKLAALIAAVDAAIYKYLGVDLTQGTKTEYYSVRPGQRRFLLRAFPVASITSVACAERGAYTSPEVLDATDYHVDSARGILTIRPSGDISIGDGEEDGLRVVYVAGLAAGWQDVAANAIYLGLDYAASIQVLAEYSRGPDWGAVSKSVGGGSRTHTVEDDQRNTPLLPKVMNLLDQYRR